MKLTVVGCGDAFGSGGRLQTCYHVGSERGQFLIDCGASALIGLRRQGLQPNDIDTVFISHLHGDHFAGLVWFFLDGQHVSRRTRPLTIVGPETIETRFLAAAEALFPGSTQGKRRFEMQFREIAPAGSLLQDDITVSAYEGSHPSGAPSLALRLEMANRTLSFSGDTEWVEDLLPAANGADLFIAECYGFDRDVRYHLNWRTIEKNLDRLGAKRVLLTHMNETMLANRHAVSDPRVVLAEDGLVLNI